MEGELDQFGSPDPSTGRPALPLNELIFRILRDHIVQDVFREGLVLRQGSVSESFGVSRAPAAMALRKLEGEGLICKRVGHGFLVGRSTETVSPVEISLEKAGLALPEAYREALRRRKLKEFIYPEVERAVASCLVFGRFRINQSTLAEHYGVSRTVAREILTNLEGLGFARPGKNARWYAGPLTFEDIKECYEIRWHLEPSALRQAAPSFRRSELLEMRNHVDEVLRAGRFAPDEVDKVEAELHSDLVLRCDNKQMRHVLVRCQLPIIATFATVLRDPARTGLASGLPEALSDHRVVLDLLLGGKIDEAVKALERHLRTAYELCVPHFQNLPPIPYGKIPPYMKLDP